MIQHFTLATTPGARWVGDAGFMGPEIRPNTVRNEPQMDM